MVSGNGLGLDLVTTEVFSSPTGSVIHAGASHVPLLDHLPTNTFQQHHILQAKPKQTPGTADQVT